MAKKTDIEKIARAVYDWMTAYHLFDNIRDGATYILEKNDFYNIMRAADLGSQYVTLRHHWVRFTADFTYTVGGADRAVIDLRKFAEHFGLCVCDTQYTVPAELPDVPSEPSICVCDTQFNHTKTVEGIIIPAKVYTDVPIGGAFL